MKKKRRIEGTQGIRFWKVLGFGFVFFGSLIKLLGLGLVFLILPVKITICSGKLSSTFHSTLVSVLNQLVITTPTDHTHHDHVQQRQQGNMLVLFETAAGYAIFKVCVPHVQHSTVQLSDDFFSMNLAA